MTRWIHTLLVWLLMLALPLQGAAAAAQSSCGPAQHAAMHAAMGHSSTGHGTGAGPDAAMPMPSQHAHVGEHGAGHTHHPQLADASDTGAMPGGAASSSSSPGADDSGAQVASSCSACAQCCVGATAPPSAAVGVVHTGPSLANFILPAQFVASHVGAGIERPPRIFSA